MNNRDEPLREEQLHTAIDTLIHTMRLHHRIVDKRMLMRLSHMGKTASQKDIATEMDVSPACVARTLKSLSAGGLIEKAEGLDGRCNEISLSPLGRPVINDSLKLFREIDAEMFKGISSSELTELTALLRRIQKNLFSMEETESRSGRS